MSVSEAAAREALVLYGRVLYDRGLAHGSAGNLSLRLEDGSILVTPTNSCLGRLTPARIAMSLGTSGALRVMFDAARAGPETPRRDARDPRHDASSSENPLAPGRDPDAEPFLIRFQLQRFGALLDDQQRERGADDRAGFLFDGERDRFRAVIGATQTSASVSGVVWAAKAIAAVINPANARV